jgi:hypothetical protein
MRFLGRSRAYVKYGSGESRQIKRWRIDDDMWLHPPLPGNGAGSPAGMVAQPRPKRGLTRRTRCHNQGRRDSACPQLPRTDLDTG